MIKIIVFSNDEESREKVVKDENKKLKEMFDNFEVMKIPDNEKGNYTVTIIKNNKMYINYPFYKIDGLETFQKLFTGDMEKNDSINIYIIPMIYKNKYYDMFSDKFPKLKIYSIK